MNDFLNCSRRDFLQLAGAGAVGVAAVASTAAAAPPFVRRPVVVVHDPDFTVPPEFTTGLGGPDAPAAAVVALSGDPVRLWRDGLKITVAAGGALYGLTLWADLLIFQGLASELRRHVRVVRQDERSGRFAWMIA